MNNNISEQIKNLRQQKGWTQNELGEKVGYSPQTISAWERGQNQPDLQAISALCKLFDVTSDQLLGIEKTTQKTPPTFSEINTIPKAPTPKPSSPDCTKIVDSYEKDSVESTVLRILLYVYAGIIGFTTIISLIGRGYFAFLILLLAPLSIPFLDLAILIMFFVAKEKRYSTLFWIYVVILVVVNVLGISLNEFPQWLQIAVQIISIACSLLLPFLFRPNNDNAPTFLNYLKTAKVYYLALFFQLIVNVLVANETVGYIFVFLLLYPLSFAQYITLYYATKNTKRKYFYTTVRHKEHSSFDIYQNKVTSPSKLGSAYTCSTLLSSTSAREHILIEKPVLPTKFLLLILLLTIPVMIIIGNSVYLPDNLALFFTIILIFFTIIPTINTLCYFIFRQGNIKLRITLCAVYTLFNVILNLVFFEFEFNYYVFPSVVVTAILGVGVVSLIQIFTLTDHEELSLTTRVALKVSFTFVEVIVLGLIIYAYFIAITKQVPILLLVWWQLIFFAICCSLKAPLTKQVVNNIYK